MQFQGGADLRRCRRQDILLGNAVSYHDLFVTCDVGVIRAFGLVREG